MCRALPHSANLSQKIIRNWRHCEGVERLLICGLKVRFLRGSPAFALDRRRRLPVGDVALATCRRTCPLARETTAGERVLVVIEFDDEEPAIGRVWTRHNRVFSALMNTQRVRSYYASRIH
jgi:hypothetical protein